MAKLADDLTSTDELEEYKHLDSDTDRVLAYLKKKVATYCALYHGVSSSSPELIPRSQKKTRTEVGASDVAGSGQLIWTEQMHYIGNQGHVQCDALPDDEVFASDLLHSKALLFSYVTSEEVVKVIGEDTADNIVTFLRSNVFVHEQHFARCFYLDVRGFDAYSNTCLEGTNYGVKYCENRVLPNMSQAKATKVMINQDEDKVTQKRKKTLDAFHKKPLRARTNTSAHVLPTAESMLQQAMAASESYISYRFCERKWWVLYSGHRNLPVRLLPVFARVRTVSIDENNRMKCSCFEYERNGIPCKHMCHVASKFGTYFESVTHHSVDIRFWTAYSLYAVVLDPSELNEDELNIRNKLETARWNSPHPPTAPAAMKSMDEGRSSVGSKSEDNFRSMTGDESFLHVETLIKNKLSILNYDVDSVEKAVAVMENHHGTAVGMTQEMHNCSADFSFVGPGDETLDPTKPVAWKEQTTASSIVRIGFFPTCHKPRPRRTNTSAHVLPTAESMLQQAMAASESYISYRVCERKWWVLYSGHRNLPVRLLPVFARFGTYFESVTHHSVDIRFWTAYSLYAVVLDPSELNEDELNIRNKLVTARWKSPQTPTGPASLKSLDEGRYSVGSKSEDKFISMTGDETSDVANPVGSHEVLNPLCKELIQLCDVAGKDKTSKTARDLESLIIALKEEIASDQSPPTGK
ncbi:SWIM zinc finger domain protein [Nitzschia inconspicua]|uniref:SWIM zinc finger domain protein n=1 Tax=Nitzschia inconspicua TaxID=303405 RepID=A0A9K3PVV0_9STRA|nr:SWIM zinc finger domain protein [Nitzschia inconspicua]